VRLGRAHRGHPVRRSPAPPRPSGASRTSAPCR
jgi:hypothetical protein